MMIYSNYSNFFSSTATLKIPDLSMSEPCILSNVLTRLKEWLLFRLM